MDSPTFEFRVSSIPYNCSARIVSFTFSDVLLRSIHLAGYVAVQDDTLHLSLSDRTTVFNRHIIRLNGLNSLQCDDIAHITRHLYHFDFPVEVCSNILQGINAAVKESAFGGVIDVRVSRIQSKVFGRNEDVLLDRIVEMWLERNWSEPKPIPADTSIIDSLEIVRYSEEEIGEGCVICMEDYDKDSKISRLPCDHVFHGDCIKKWLQINHQCPLCRFQMSH